jgi:hypothetical protein
VPRHSAKCEPPQRFDDLFHKLANETNEEEARSNTTDISTIPLFILAAHQHPTLGWSRSLLSLGGLFHFFIDRIEKQDKKE